MIKDSCGHGFSDKSQVVSQLLSWSDPMEDGLARGLPSNNKYIDQLLKMWHRVVAAGAPKQQGTTCGLEIAHQECHASMLDLQCKSELISLLECVCCCIK